MKRAGLLLVLIAMRLMVNAQLPVVYDNKIYAPAIRTVECYNSKKEQSFPVIALNSAETITLGFDDLSGGSRNYSYSIEHCTYDWKPSGLNHLDFVESFQDDILPPPRFSFNTLQKFAHYQLRLPNEQVKPKIAGNYLLRVYERNNPERVVLTQRFYVVNPTVGIAAEVVPNSDVQFRTTRQKVNFTISHPFPIPNPQQSVKALVMQNAVPQSAILNTRPAFVKQNALVYNDMSSNEFQAGNEFRRVDFRSLRFNGEHVQERYRDSVNTVVLFTDQARNNDRYTSETDENGAFYVRNQDGRDNITDSDYAHVIFSLEARPPAAKGDVYVTGKFNQYLLNEESRLTYDAEKKRYGGKLTLKQGVYDFKYVWADETGRVDDTVLEGSFFETGNDYQILVYYRRPGARWDELLGFTEINSLKR